MSYSDNKLLDILKDLKENHNICGIKAEFGEEGINYEEASFLKGLASDADLNFTIKIGGCEALRDIKDAKKLDANTIVAPMIESEYACQKFIKAVETAYNMNIPKDLKLYINIETITGYKNLENILHHKDFSVIEGIIMGRTDFTLSLGMTKNQTDCNDLYEIAENIANLAHKNGKKFIVGGNISADSVNFLKKLYPNNIDKFETRKVIFDINNLDENKLHEGIIKALEFELVWLNYKKEVYDSMTTEDYKRIENLEAKCNFIITK